MLSMYQDYVHIMMSWHESSIHVILVSHWLDKIQVVVNNIKKKKEKKNLGDENMLLMEKLAKK